MPFPNLLSGYVPYLSLITYLNRSPSVRLVGRTSGRLVDGAGRGAASGRYPNDLPRFSPLVYGAAQNLGLQATPPAARGLVAAADSGDELLPLLQPTPIFAAELRDLLAKGLEERALSQRYPFGAVAAPQSIHGYITIPAVDLKREQVPPLGPAGMKGCHLSPLRAQQGKNVILQGGDRPEARGDQSGSGHKITQEPAEEVKNV